MGYSLRLFNQNKNNTHFKIYYKPEVHTYVKLMGDYTPKAHTDAIHMHVRPHNIHALHMGSSPKELLQLNPQTKLTVRVC